jgi:hypothetical protein
MNFYFDVLEQLINGWVNDCFVGRDDDDDDFSGLRCNSAAPVTVLVNGKQGPLAP